MSSSDTLHFRHPGATWVAALIGFICALPLASAAWYFTPVLLIPLAIGVWGWRSGTDADREGVRVRALLGQRRIGWSQVSELGADRRGGALALLRDGRTIALPAVAAGDLPRLVAASGQTLGGTTNPQ